MGVAILDTSSVCMADMGVTEDVGVSMRVLVVGVAVSYFCGGSCCGHGSYPISMCISGVVPASSNARGCGDVGQLLLFANVSSIKIMASSSHSSTSSLPSTSASRPSSGTSSKTSASSLLRFSSKASFFCLNLALSISGQLLRSVICPMILVTMACWAPLRLLLRVNSLN